MNIIVVGCGKIGLVTVSSLVAEGHNVTVIDTDSKIVNDTVNIYDVMGVCGNGADSDALLEAGITETDIFIAVTGSDELNMLSCFFAKKMGAKHTVARIRNTDYNDKSLSLIKQYLDLSLTVNPERLVANELYNILKLPSAVRIQTFSGRQFEMIEIALKNDSKLDGLSLREIRENFKEKFLVCTVQRNNKTYIPDGNFVLKGGDIIGLTASPIEMNKLLKKLNIMQKQAKNVMIMGASRISYYLAHRLINNGTNVKIIDIDQKRCEEFGELLPEVDIINGDGAQQEILLEEGIGSMDAFVALTGMDEENILISFFAKSQNVPKVIPKINREEFAHIARNLGLDTIISARNTVADVIVQYARAIRNSLGSKVEKLYNLNDGTAEAVEFKVTADFRGLQTPLKELQLKSDILVAGIIRGSRAIIPDGEEAILPGDKVVVIAAGKKLQDLSDILK